jgi:predicted nucleic acid-binding protein
VIAYVDSSVLLRVLLGQPGALREWPEIVRWVASGLVEVECLRTIDRLRLRGLLTLEEAVDRREAAFRILEAMELIELTPAVLHRASQPMPAPLGTLDAIHLASASMWREVCGMDLLMTTHDEALALAARATGFRVAGV